MLVPRRSAPAVRASASTPSSRVVMYILTVGGLGLHAISILYCHAIAMLPALSQNTCDVLNNLFQFGLHV